MRRMAGKVIVVTGASSGLGAVTVVRLAELGAVPILIARRADKLAEVAKDIHGEHGILEADVTQEEQVKRTVREIMDRFGKIDGWVNNAGAGIFERFMDTETEQFEQMMRINYMSVVYSMKAVLPTMIAAGGGTIVNVVSVAGKVGTAKATAYSASKHAALGLSNSLRAELAGTGVKICTVNPGPIDTPFFDIADPSGQYKNNISWFMLKPRKVADAICKALATGKADITMPRLASVGAKALHLFPNGLSGISARLLGKK